ncbi:hypothetical protein PENSTE_c025G04570 [Penicillium steckii]|uniref:Uncharacterized protein n=1 Tax=Penicillium steckii TaxID=303698 RepID=A0A1V6SQ70_9EURO|nr:hypothetical protein PENSTE_c025G04570 [Penicillium steckii]
MKTPSKDQPPFFRSEQTIQTATYLWTEVSSPQTPSPPTPTSTSTPACASASASTTTTTTFLPPLTIITFTKYIRNTSRSIFTPRLTKNPRPNSIPFHIIINNNNHIIRSPKTLSHLSPSSNNPPSPRRLRRL